ncbi:MAG: MoaD/ThiS family protein [bacterium]|nr:MoaD/ThiS family protein [bacterium]
MAVVWIPSLMRNLTGGVEQIEVEGETLREVINRLDVLHPGVKARVMDDDETRIRPGLAVAVDGIVTEEGLRTVVRDALEIHFVTAISGG